jgi:hypothetical protein
MTIGINDTHHNSTCCYADCYHAVCHYTECRYDECHYAKCFGANLEDGKLSQVLGLEVRGLNGWKPS